MYRYQFRSTVEDLLQAVEAERSVSLRWPLRGTIIVLGLAWLAGGLAIHVGRPTVLPLVWTCLGAGSIYYFVVRPHQRRSRIRTHNAACQDLRLDFADDGLILDIGGFGEFRREWDELVGITDTKRGILFYFSDGAKSWLPNRVFASEVERGRFVEFLKGHQAQRREKAGDSDHAEP
jgi:hypothetical protein